MLPVSELGGKDGNMNKGVVLDQPVSCDRQEWHAVPIDT